MNCQVGHNCASIVLHRENLSDKNNSSLDGGLNLNLSLALVCTMCNVILRLCACEAFFASTAQQKAS